MARPHNLLSFGKAFTSTMLFIKPKNPKRNLLFVGWESKVNHGAKQPCLPWSGRSLSQSKNMFSTDLWASMKQRTNKSLTGEGIVGIFQLHALHLCAQINLDIDALGIRRCVEEPRGDFRGNVRLFAAKAQVVEDFLWVLFIQVQQLWDTGGYWRLQCYKIKRISLWSWLFGGKTLLGV